MKHFDHASSPKYNFISISRYFVRVGLGWSGSGVMLGRGSIDRAPILHESRIMNVSSRFDWPVLRAPMILHRL